MLKRAIEYRQWAGWVLLAAAVLGMSPASAEPVRELRVWVEGNNRGVAAAMQHFIRQQPDWKLVTSAYQGGLDARKLMTAIAGGDPPDLIMQDRFTVGEWAARDAFYDLDDFIAQSQRNQESGGPENPGAPDGIFPEEFYDACWNETVYEGNVFGIPYSTDTRALYYLEDALLDAGLVDDQGNPRPPADWDELQEYTSRLTKRDDAGRITRLGFAPNFGNSFLYLYGWLNGGSFMTDDGRTVTMKQPKNVEALRYMQRLYDDVGGIARTDAFFSASSGVEFDPFATGKLAMKIDGNWQLRNLAEYHPTTRFSVAMPPAPKGMPSQTWAGGFAYVVPSTARHPEMGFELARFLVSDEGWGIIHEVNARYMASRGRGYIPRMAAQPAVNARVLRDYVLPDPNVPTRIKEALPVFHALMEHARFRPVTPVGQLLWDEHNRAFEQATRGGVDAQVALDRATQAVQERLDIVLREQGGEPVRWSAVVLWFSVTFVTVAVAGVYLAHKRGVFKRYSKEEMHAAAVYVSPWVLGFVVFTAGPVLASLVYVFCRYSVLEPAEWVGFNNLSRLFFDDPMFWYSLANTAYMLRGVPLGMALGLGIAMLLNTEVRGIKVYRTIFYLPAIVPLVASSILWIWVLNPENGLINASLRMIGIEDPPLWLNSPSWGLGSKAAILLMGLWGAGGSMIIWLSGLKGIPEHLYEAAKIDGAGLFTRFRHVTLPMLTPYIFFNLIMGVIGTMQIFTQAFIMTQGGPADSTMYYAYYLFNRAFRYFEMGYASALAWVLLIIILALTALQMWSSRRWVHYETS
jgi:multiple sugar transport system permease protein